MRRELLYSGDFRALGLCRLRCHLVTSLLAFALFASIVSLPAQTTGLIVFAGFAYLLLDCSPVSLVLISGCFVMLVGFVGQCFVFGDSLFGCVIGSDC